MFTTLEQFAAANKAAVDAMLSLTNTALTSAERIAALNLNTARSLLEDVATNTKAILGAKDPQEAMALQAAQVQPALVQIVAYNRSLYGISAQSKQDVSKLLENQYGDFQEQVLNLLDKATKNAPAGSEAAVTAVKSALTVVNSAFDNMNNAVRQAGEMAEANIVTASNATIKAAGSVNNGKKKSA